MDTFTQAALGATIAEAGFRNRLGGKAVVFGAVCGLLPDLDIIVRALGPWESLVHHRGLTHSLLTLPVLALPVGWAGWKLSKKEGDWKTWAHLAFWALITHPLLDACTSYGTQLLAPLSDERFSTDAVGIIDLLYSVPLFAAVFAARWSHSEVRTKVARLALLGSTVYLGAGHLLSYQAEMTARASLESNGVHILHVRTPPPAFFSGLRRLVAVDTSGTVWAANLSVWFPHELDWVQITGEQDPQIEAVLASEEGQIFSWFADGYALAERVDAHTVVIRDHRYGMFLDLSWTPFRLQAELDSDGQVQTVELQQDADGLDLGAELSEGLRQMWGSNEPG
jgi:inner membrane protein